MNIEDVENQESLDSNETPEDRCDPQTKEERLECMPADEQAVEFAEEFLSRAASQQDFMEYLCRNELDQIASGLESIQGELKVISERLQRLEATQEKLTGEFHRLSANTAALEKASEQLQQHTDAFYESTVLDPLARSLFPIYDFVTGTLDQIDGRQEESHRALAKFAKAVGSDTLTLLGTYGIEPFRHEPGAEFDGKTMQVMKYRDADDPARHLRVQRSCRPGFRDGDRVLRCEAVILDRFVNNENVNTEDKDPCDS